MPEADAQMTADEAVTAAVVAFLVADMRSWVTRRVEQVEIVNDTAVLRRNSIDYRLPEQVGDVDVGDALVFEGEAFVPISFLRKEPLRNFDLRNSNGLPLPMLSRRQNGRLATNVLCAQAQAVLDDEVSDAVRQSLSIVAEGSPRSARDEFVTWPQAAAAPGNPDTAAWQALINSEGFMALAEALIEDFIVCAVTEAKPGRRTLVKLSYEEQLGRITQRMLAWRWTLVSFDADQARLADSYHFEMVAPQETKIGLGVMGFSPLDNPDAEPVGQLISDIPPGERLHLYTRDVPRRVEPGVVVAVRPRREGTIRASVAVSILTALVLWLTYGSFESVTDQTRSQVTAAFLLLGPTLLAAALVRPGEHQLVTKQLLGVRALVGGSMLASLGCVAILAGVGSCSAKSYWLDASLLASACALGILLAWVLPLPLSDE